MKKKEKIITKDQSMIDLYNSLKDQDQGKGVCDVATFDDLMLEILDKHAISYEHIINHILKDL